MAYLFDTDAISEVLRSRPSPAFLHWLESVPRELQYTSAVTIGELFRGAYQATAARRHLRNVEGRVLPALTVLPYDTTVARVCGRIQARLRDAGRPVADADAQIAATAIAHGLRLVTGNLRHFERIDGLVIEPALIEARKRPDRSS